MPFRPFINLQTRPIMKKMFWPLPYCLAKSLNMFVWRRWWDGPSWMFDDNYSNSYPPILHPLYYIITAINHYLSCPHRPWSSPPLPVPESATLTFSSSNLHQPSWCKHWMCQLWYLLNPSLKSKHLKPHHEKNWEIVRLNPAKSVVISLRWAGWMFLVVSSVRRGMACILCALV